MKLSDAIVLGSTGVKLDPKNWLNIDPLGNKCGCLIGMGLFAKLGDNAYMELSGTAPKAILQEWPWLGDYRDVPDASDLPSAIKSERAIEIVSALARRLALGRVSFEEAVEWIRQNEPKEEEVNGGSKDTSCTGHESPPIVRCGDPEGVGVITRE